MSRLAIRALLALACLAAVGAVVLFFSEALPYKVYAVRTGSMSPAIPSRSAVIVREGVYHVGQAISYRTPNGIVTHRIVEQLPDGRLQTKGDANRTEDPYTVRPSNVIGGVVAAPRMLGYWLVYFKNPAGLASLFLTVILLGLVYSLPADLMERKEERQGQPGGMTVAPRAVHAPYTRVAHEVPSTRDPGALAPGSRLQGVPSTPARQVPSYTALVSESCAVGGQSAAQPGLARTAARPRPDAAPTALLASAATATPHGSTGPVAQPAPTAPAASRPSARVSVAPVPPVPTREGLLSAAVATLTRLSPDVEAAALVSLDGLVMTSAMRQETPRDRIGAMSAAILGLGERVALELGSGKLSQVLVAGDAGYIAVVAVGDSAVLTALARIEAVPSLLLGDMRDTARTIADILG